MNANNYCIIMAGGSGTRFWPMSRNAKPKQFLDILGQGKSLLRSTFWRMAHIVPVENILIVTSRQYVDIIRDQVPQIPEDNILAEPYRRNTAPCIAYAVYKILEKNPEAGVVITPSDHHIMGETNFASTIQCALDNAAPIDRIFTIGVVPSHPDTNYGYIQINKTLARDLGGHQAYGVKTFTEKPDEALAKVFVSTGEFLWNSGMFIAGVKTLVAEFETCLPAVASIFAAGKGKYCTPQEKDFINRAYHDCPNISFDYGVMEKTRKARVIKADFGWSDVGTWTSIYEHSPHKDSSGNIVKASDNLISNTRGCIVKEDNAGKLVVIKGLENYIVVDTGDVLMICPLSDKAVKETVADLTSGEKTKFL